MLPDSPAARPSSGQSPASALRHRIRPGTEQKPSGTDALRIETLIPTILRRAAPQPLPPVEVPLGPHSGTLVRTILTSLEDSKAEDIVTIDLHGKTNIADSMIIASGRSNIHVGAIADRVIKAFKDTQHVPPRVEGLQNCDWVLIDAGDVIVHIFRPEVREFYNLEKMWGVDRPGERRAS